MYLALVHLIIFFVCAAFLFGNGLWSNALLLFNLVTAALFALNFYEPLANWLEQLEPTTRYLADFVALWGLFAFFLGIFRAATDFLSPVKVRFKPPIEKAGGLIFACWVGWMMVCFTTLTLHTAPLAENFLNGNFSSDPSAKRFMGLLAPDVEMLGFMQQVSKGAFSRGNPFDPGGDFIENTRRVERASSKNSIHFRPNKPAIEAV